MTLSKSMYSRGLQCEKSLWLHKHRPELSSYDEGTIAIMNSGTSVGEVARGLFPGGKLVEFDEENFDAMLEETERLLVSESVIYEATFKEGGVFAMVDILVKNGEGSWNIYEVKASTEVEGHHYDDVAVQYFAVSKVVDVKRAYIVHINNGYERIGRLEIDKLFRIEDITKEVLNKQEEIKSNLKKFEMILQSDTEPEVDIGPHCSDPYDCDFYDYCWEKIPETSVFNLYKLNEDKKWEYYSQGKIHLDALTGEDIEKLTRFQKIQFESHMKNIPHIDKQVIKDFFKEIVYPVYFLDFETFMEPIPRFDHQRPYEQVPFQYSLHILHPNGTLDHREFIGDGINDPRESLTKKLISDIGTRGSVIAYNASFEKGVIRNLARRFVKYAKQLEQINERLLDLMTPFRRGGYYDPAFNGSLSMKSILPGMFPDREDLSYDDVGEIHYGGEAMNIYVSLKDMPPEQRQYYLGELLKYCKLDTYGMVEMFGKLGKIKNN